MLKRLLTTDEPTRLVLVSDPAVVEAQQRAARRMLDADLGAASGEDLAGLIAAAVRAASGSHAQVVSALQTLMDVGRGIIDSTVGEGEQAEALDRIQAALEDEDTRESLAHVRASIALTRYHGSSDLADLLDPDMLPDVLPSGAVIDGATWFTVRALSRAEARQAREACGLTPRLGAELFGRASDVSRKAHRTGNPAGMAFARFLSGLTDADQAEVEKYEAWTADMDRETVARGLLAIEGADDLTPEPGEAFPVGRLIRTVAGGSAIVAEVAQHVRRVGTLGKAESLPVSSSGGTDEPSSGPPLPVPAGRAHSASETRL